jgi:hypothetical protein
VRSGGVHDAGDRGIRKEGGARLTDRPGRPVDRVEKMLVDRVVDGHGLSRKVHFSAAEAPA